MLSPRRETRFQRNPGNRITRKLNFSEALIFEKHAFAEARASFLEVCLPFAILTFQTPFFSLFRK